MASDNLERNGNEDASSDRVPDPVAMPPADFGVCGRCGEPLTRPGIVGGCLRCMARLAFAQEDELLDHAGATGERRRYSHFEIALASDGSLSELGHGAMGVTYRAIDTVLQSPVALKIIGKNVADSPEVRRRFLREARAAARLRHPNVAGVFHYGEQDGECFYVMELVEGETLEARVRRDGPLPLETALETGVQVARALAAAEAQGLVHRDLKPSNIMLVRTTGDSLAEDESLLVKVIDFGLAKAVVADEGPGENETRRGFVGTPVYASPEQFAGGEQPVNIRSDIYSLGVTLWYALCGRVPFSGRSLEEIHARQIDQALPLDQLAAHKVPAPTVRLLRSMLATDPGARPASARELLALLHRCREQGSSRAARQIRRGRRLRWIAFLALLGAAVAGAVFWWHRAEPPGTPADRTLAVLPFENLSPDAADASLAMGVRVQISDSLARVAALTVIDSSSADYYPPGKRDLAAIGRELGVWHLLEGSVRQDAGQVRVVVRLIDLRDPAHSWERHYDRLLADVFSVQGEATRAVAGRLGATLSPRERAAVDDPPTRDPKAFDLYLRATGRTDHSASSEEAMQFDRDVSIPLLEEAVARDPKFVSAYCYLVRQHDQLEMGRKVVPSQGPPVDHRRLAEAALANARRLRPDDAVVHFWQALHFVWILKDNEQARIEIELARRDLPNDYSVEIVTGHIARSQNRWTEAARCYERGFTLNPRDLTLRETLAHLYREMRRYEDYERTVAPLIAADTPHGSMTERQFRAMVAVERRADLEPYETVRASIAAEEGKNRPWYQGQISLALLRHDPQALSDCLAANPQSSYGYRGILCTRAWFDALAARMRRDDPAARTALLAARVDADAKAQAAPLDGQALGFLAMIDAGLGNKTEAVREALRACDLCPLTDAAENAPLTAFDLAVVYAWTEQPELACNVIEEWMNRPVRLVMPLPFSYGDLKLNPLWDPLRGQARFEALIQRLASGQKP